MEATLTDLRRQAARVIRAVRSGQPVVLTEHGRSVAHIIPALPVRTFTDLAAFREGHVSDSEILEAVDDARNDYAAWTARHA